ncbi:MAG: hypothetical protein AAF639_22160 [Chloroflexota bacterium]
MKVRKSGTGYIFTHGEESLTFNDLSELIAARTALADYIDKLAYRTLIDIDSDEVELINTAEAREIALEHGFKIGNKTILYAAENIIKKAKKDGTRWIMPKSSFLKWLEAYKAKQPKPTIEQ